MTATRVKSVRGFDSALEQIEGEVKWLSLRLSVVVERARRQRSVGPPAEYRGLYVTDEEVDSFLYASDGATLPVDQLLADAAGLRKALDERSRATASAGLQLPLEHVVQEFRLSPAERQILLVALAPYFDPAFEKIYAYTNDDITKRWPTVGLALDILCDDRREIFKVRRLFYADAPLSRHHLLTAGEPGSASPLLNRQVALDPHIAEVLLGFRGLDPRLQTVARRVDASRANGVDAGRLARVLQERVNARIYLGGRWRGEKLDAVVAACSQAGLELIVVNTPALHRVAEPSVLVSLVLRDARLLGAALIFDDWGGAEGNADTIAFSDQLAHGLADHPLAVFFSDRPPAPVRPPVDLNLQIEFPPPAFEDRQREWRAVGAFDPEDAAHLAATYRLGVREITAAGVMARSLASLREKDQVSLEELKAAARTQSQPRLSSLAQKITPHFTWDDIVLPPDRLAQLREIAHQVLYQHIVYDEWRLAAKSSLGRGVAALFAGQSGTGKTMAAEIIGQDLGLEVYKIDLSGLVSKYIGETEKNLARVFEEASDTNVILFFDEADAVFGKRSEVRDSHDRYANIEVSYLLQKMEEYDGIVVLATNMRSNLDEAFLRRMRAIVEFPFPEVDDRLRIWQRTLSSSAPLAGDVDLAFMARQFRIAGGNIRNVVLLAAFLAASASQAIGMPHLIQATKREYQKLGRLLTESDFGQWYEAVRP